MEVALLFGLIIALLLAGVPIAVSLGLSSVLFLLVFSDSSLAGIAGTLFEALMGPEIVTRQTDPRPALIAARRRAPRSRPGTRAG